MNRDNELRLELDRANLYLQAGYKNADLADLQRGIDLIESVMAVVPPGHEVHARGQVNLTNGLRLRFTLTMDPEDLDGAITAGREAKKALPTWDHAMPGLLANLASALVSRFELYSDPNDLREGIADYEQGMKAPALRPEVRVAVQANLANARRGQYALERNLDDLNAVIDLETRALNDPAAQHNLAAIHIGLSDALRLRYERTECIDDLNAAIQHGLDAVELTGGQGQLALRLNTLGLAQRVRAGKTKRLEHLNEAVDTAQQAVNEADGPLRALWLANLSAAAILRYENTNQPSDLSKAIEAGQQGFEMTLAPPRFRAQAARCWAEAEATGRRWREAVGAYAKAIGLLDALVPSDLDPLGQQLQLDSVSGLGPDAAACCVQVGDADRAIELFEQGRGVLLRQTLDTRTGSTRAGQRLSAAELCTAAAVGPVVVVIVSRFGSCALILASDGVRDPIPLPSLTPETVYGQVKGLLGAFGAASQPGGSRAHENAITETLGWLWEAVAAPVLEGLGWHDHHADGEPWLRVWWCASGLLSLLPLHASGKNSATVRSRAVSSYTPTIRALIHGRQTGSASYGVPAEGVAADGRVVAIAMRHTPGHRELTEALAEAEWLKAHHPGRVTLLPDEAATHEAVIGALPDSQWAHFACHGSSNAANPTASALLLRDQPLKVLDVNRLHLAGAELAFLSACSTAQTSPRLADEVINMASAFQVAGYRHVIGTLWPVADTQARETAELIYAALGRGETVANAVHAAISNMSLQWFDTPSRWASHVHVGA
jgi:tetratricopeptide (TPR) repeat protein